ncbi:MAG: hypothetical protein MZV70_60500 [Desulfobacterales bacterium]|nr:hypothetical protein [Desulfobacterales bacterium]
MPLIAVGARFFSRRMHRRYQAVQASFSRSDRGRPRARRRHPPDQGPQPPGGRGRAGGGGLARLRGREPEAGANHRAPSSR